MEDDEKGHPLFLWCRGSIVDMIPMKNFIRSLSEIALKFIIFAEFQNQLAKRELLEYL